MVKRPELYSKTEMDRLQADLSAFRLSTDFRDVAGRADSAIRELRLLVALFKGAFSVMAFAIAAGAVFFMKSGSCSF